jgi:hypothetical protein
MGQRKKREAMEGLVGRQARIAGIWGTEGSIAGHLSSVPGEELVTHWSLTGPLGAAHLADLQLD